MARPRPRALRHHAALCRHQHARAVRACRRAVARASRKCSCRPTSPKTCRDRAGARAFPQRRDYLDVYAHYGLIGRRAVLAHGVHFGESEFCRCHESGTALAHCPTSNTFLGSGLFAMRDARDPRRPVEVGLGTDIGGGTSFSLLATMGEAYKVAQLRGQGHRRDRGVLSRDLGRRARAGARRQASGRWRPVARPIWSCSIPGPRRCWHSAASARARSKNCSRCW